MTKIFTKKEVFDKIFNAYNYGNLGMFIGAGFSKAVISDDTQPALGWYELIKMTSENLDIEFPDDKDLIEVSLPELATNLCKNLATRKNINYDEAKSLFKNKICYLSNWLPNERRTKDFKEIMDILNPSWVITTNYDMVLETILTGKCKSLSPTDYLSAPKNVTPIYHLHGTRLDPNSIVVTQDDYIPLFRPNEYRQSKLALTIRESTTLILGYGLGDMNVLSAVDWSKNIYTEETEYPPYEVIQVHWTSSPKQEVYRDENNNLIMETSDLEGLLNELIDYIVNKQYEYDSKLKELNQLINVLESGDDKYVQKFIDERDFRLRLLDTLSEFEYVIISPYIQFLTLCINGIWSKTSDYGNFQSYDKYLCILLDIITKYDFKKMPPKLFQITAESLNRVLNYVDESPSNLHLGNSWSATRSWQIRKKEIPQEMINQLYYYSKQNQLFDLHGKLDNLAKN